MVENRISPQTVLREIVVVVALCGLFGMVESNKKTAGLLFLFLTLFGMAESRKNFSQWDLFDAFLGLIGYGSDRKHFSQC